MVTVSYSPSFKKTVTKIKDASLKEKVKKQIKKIVADSETGKPMKYVRQGTKEVYIPPFRLSYSYIKDEDRIVFLDLYHKDEQ